MPEAAPEPEAKPEAQPKAQPTPRTKKPKVRVVSKPQAKPKRPSVASARVAQSKVRAQKAAVEAADGAADSGVGAAGVERAGALESAPGEGLQARVRRAVPERPEGTADAASDRGDAAASDGAPESAPPVGPDPSPTSESSAAPSSSGSVIDGLREESSERPEKRRLPFTFTPLRMTLAVVALLCAVLIALSAAFCWNRWWRYDDAADFKGLWFVEGTDVPVAIDETTIKLTDDVSYTYEIDAGAKTISFDFGNMKGSGRYYFSDDRRELVVIDGEGYTASSTLMQDVGRAFASLQARIAGREPETPSGEGVSVFARQPAGAGREAGDAASAAEAADAQGREGSDGSSG
ncbi:MAG: hypothetical protein SOW20_02880 [Berryella intestinalis]|uniref:hypothetical protein n=1 Tax=Berryella intestinalis TaxID=1531429 RepID=UPI002A74FCCB|nr:hypothetical protein [Berryella intestinalis]MDY3128955.1 hypothetical protein [Berryella intestinalis]